jgi:mucin-19
VANAVANLGPRAEAYVGTGSTLQAGRNVTVDADLKKTPSTPPPSDVIKDGPDADSLAVDIDADTLDFGFPLGTGTTVTYVVPAGAAPIGGLADGREYNVIAFSEGKIRLGNLFAAATSGDPPHRYHHLYGAAQFPGGRRRALRRQWRRVDRRALADRVG